ncbi:tetratricopeptide repeat protein [Occallatibacter riparius]|uniref:Tetratricopeptide repeat protein n=1 Tax=Occallatibacter riparius TaxID=1002689 RepID=A0A9J7BXB1_9BACT|nr:tetratricopeptide repeat protein [Occallatibacter riparius]UWZ85598.1 tetratricopeptide repeat protein [Occallatibacter riparius]
MSSLCSPGMKCLLLAACLGFAGTAHAVCNGPQAMVAKMRAQPNVANAAALGNWYASHEQFPCAIETFRAGLKTDAGSGQLHYLLGLALVASKQPGQALPELEKSAELAPAQLKPHLLLASLYEDAGKPEDAEREWRKAIAIDPKSEEALEGITGILMQRQDYAGVIQVLQGAPRTENLSIALARAFGLLNYPDQAEKVLNEALKEHPGSLSLQKAMLVVLVRQRNYEGAIRLAKQMSDSHPEDVDAELEYFRLLVLQNHVDEAVALGPKLLAARPKDPEVLFLNGLARRAAGDNAQSKTYLEQAVALQPDSMKSHYELGNTLVLLREWAEAKTELEKAIAMGASDPEVHFALAKALRGVGETDRATEETKKFQQIKKDQETQLEAAESVAQGDTALDAGKASEAVAHYKEALEQQPDNANYHYKLAIALSQSGEGAGERQELEKAIALDARLPGAQNALGVLLSQTGDADEAVKHFQQAVQGAPGWPEAWINLAAELAVTRRFREAKQAVAKALELDPKNQQARELSDQLARDPAAQ